MKPKGIGKLTAVTINGQTIFTMLRISSDGSYKLNLTDEMLSKLAQKIRVKPGDCVVVG